MAVVKCPRCEINYMRDDEECCSVCMRELRREKNSAPVEDDLDMCVECGIAPAVTKEGLCAQCALDIQNFALDEEDRAPSSESGESASDGALDIISLELVEDEDEGDLLDLDFQDLEEDLGFEDENDEDDLDEDEEDDDGYSDLILSPVKVAR